MEYKKIISKDNEKIKLLRKLGQKKHREKYNKFFVENFNIIKDAGVNPVAIFVTESFVNKHKKDIDHVLKSIEEVYIISDKVNKTFSDLDTPSGVCAVYEHQKEEINMKERIVYLNGVSDPGNLGTILRSALAFDLNNIVIDEACVDLYNAKTINAAKDSIFKLNIVHDKNLKILKDVKSKMKIFATRLEGGDDVIKLKKNKLFCIVLGNEARGVDKKIQNMSDKFIKIKISNKIESLNVATAGSIIFYEISRE